MRVVLKTNIKSLGQKGDVVQVSDGYANTALIPTGKAEIVTPAKENLLERQNQEKTARYESGEPCQRGMQKINGKSVAIYENATGDRLFGSVKAQDVSEALKASYDVTIPSDAISVDHLKTVGDHDVVIDLGDAKCQIVVTIAKR